MICSLAGFCSESKGRSMLVQSWWNSCSLCKLCLTGKLFSFLDAKSFTKANIPWVTSVRLILQCCSTVLFSFSCPPCPIFAQQHLKLFILFLFSDLSQTLWNQGWFHWWVKSSVLHLKKKFLFERMSVC